MSFILDALKKVEKRKTGSGEIRVAEEVLGRRRARRYAGAAMLIGIAVMSAVVTAGVMRFFAGEGSDPVSASEVSSTSQASSPSPAAVMPREAPEPEPEPEPEPVTLTPESGPARTRAASASAVVTEPRAKAPAVRPESEPKLTNLDDAAAEPEPAPLSELVLQGTSVLNGEPVAVISDHRVFVGDRVGGAVVISIEAGRVVLEREGERLELTL